MNKKNVIITIVAMLLACVISVGGALAYLSATTGTLSNTFTVGDIFAPGSDDPDADDFSGLNLRENKVARTEEGFYMLVDDEYVTFNDYAEVIPGIDIDKNSTVTIGGLKADIYAFVEIVDNTDGKVTFGIDCEWEDTGIIGAHGGEVYCVATNGGIIPAYEANDEKWIAKVIDGDQLIVDGEAEGELGTIRIYAYACQALGFATAVDAYNHCF